MPSYFPTFAPISREKTKKDTRAMFMMIDLVRVNALKFE